MALVVVQCLNNILRRRNNEIEMLFDFEPLHVDSTKVFPDPDRARFESSRACHDVRTGEAQEDEVDLVRADPLHPIALEERRSWRHRYAGKALT